MSETFRAADMVTERPLFSPRRPPGAAPGAAMSETFRAADMVAEPGESQTRGILGDRTKANAASEADDHRKVPKKTPRQSLSEAAQEIDLFSNHKGLSASPNERTKRLVRTVSRRPIQIHAQDDLTALQWQCAEHTRQTPLTTQHSLSLSSVD